MEVYKPKIPISAFIICKNEEKKIEQCLEQLAKIAAEIIVVDSGSTDTTLEIVKRYTSKVFHQDWLGYGKQKNFALSKCSYEWVLSLDADEVLTDELVEEIKNLPLVVSANSKQSFSLNPPGYQLARKLFIDSRFIKYGGYYPDYQLRLFKKSLGRFCESPVHESVEIFDTSTMQYSKDRSKCPRLKQPLNHFSYGSVSELERAFDNFARLSLKRKPVLLALISAVYTFVYRYFVRLGILNGLLGIHLAWIHSIYTFKKNRPC